MVNAYIFDLVGVLVDLDMGKVNEYFAQEGKSDLFQLRKSPESEVRLQAESDFEQTLEKAVLSGYVPATPVPGVEEIREAIIEDPTGNLVIYSNGTTSKTILTLLEVAGIKEGKLTDNGGLYVLDGKACGNKDLLESYQKMISLISNEKGKGDGLVRLIPRLFVDDQKANALAAGQGIRAYSQGGFEMSVWLDRKQTGESSGHGIVVMQNLSQVASYLKYEAARTKDRRFDL
ncbi:MAG: hypothetical protein WCV90_04905 [Candidatus Woesearchaeota archaeon]|jgi:hypothetical protein